MLAPDTIPARPGPRPPGAGSAPETGATRPLTVLLVHNFYQLQGGEDRVFETEGHVLEAMGHRVLRYTLHNDAVEGTGRAALAARTVWSRESYAAVEALVRDEAVDVAHIHNTLPLASPSVYYAARRAGAAVVQTLHNFRLVCPGALLMRDGALCHDCVGRAVALPAIQHGCYRDSRAATAVLVGTTALHRAAGTYDHAVDRYIALSEFARGQFVDGGLPADRIVVKHNMLADEPALGPGGGPVLFAGRLVEAKGIGLILEAWASDPSLPPLDIAGDGPLAAQVEAAASADPRIRWLGWQDSAAMNRLVQHASLLLAPSMWYEGWPLVVVEAMATGTPVVATRHGAFVEAVVDGITGRLVPNRDVAALAEAVHELTESPAALHDLRGATHQIYHSRFSREANYGQLRAIYAEAMASHAASLRTSE